MKSKFQSNSFNTNNIIIISIIKLLFKCLKFQQSYRKNYSDIFGQNNFFNIISLYFTNEKETSFPNVVNWIKQNENKEIISCILLK